MTHNEAANSIGKLIMYEPFSNCSERAKDYGIITGVNSLYAFVRFGSYQKSEYAGFGQMTLIKQVKDCDVCLEQLTKAVKEQLQEEYAKSLR
jgi:hypothetical protein